MLYNFIINFVIKFTIVKKNSFKFSHLRDDETVFLYEILHFDTSS
jgi:hypothetical protein